MNRILFFLLIALLVFTGWYYLSNPLKPQLRVAGRTFSLELAITPEEKERGLANRDFLPADHGMLFVFDHKDRYPFWMKGMRFPLDIIWIDDTTVVYVSESVPVATEEAYPSYMPTVSVNKVFEVAAGTVEKLGISVGDKVEIFN